MNRISVMILIACLAHLGAGCESLKSAKKAASVAADVAALARPDAAASIAKAKSVFAEEKPAAELSEAELIAVLAARYGYAPSVVYRHKGAVVESSDLSKSITLEKVRTADSSEFVLDSTPEFSSVGSSATPESKAKATLNKIADEVEK